MPTEGANFIRELVTSSPDDPDWVSEGDNELRQLKHVLDQQFPETPVGPVKNAGEGAQTPDEANSGAINILLWSPKAVADFVKTYFAGWGLTPATGSNSFRGAGTFQGDLANGQTQQLSFDVTAAGAWDTGGWYDADNNRYVPLQAGVWRFNAAHALDWTPDRGRGFQELWLLRNGADVVGKANAVIAADSEDTDSVLVDALVKMNGTTDYLEVFYKFSSSKGGSENWHAGLVDKMWFEGHWVGEAAA